MACRTVELRPATFSKTGARLDVSRALCEQASPDVDERLFAVLPTVYRTVRPLRSGFREPAHGEAVLE
jgi:hypothetical protein